MMIRSSKMQPMQPCPPEKIVLLIVTGDRIPKNLQNQSSKQQSATSVAKKCAEAFLLNKSAMHPEHQFMVFTLKSGSVVSLSNGFHNKVADLVKQVRSVSPIMNFEQPVQMSRILEQIHERIIKTVVEDEGEHPVRIVVLYARAGTCTLEENIFSGYHNVVIDLLYIHKTFQSSEEKKRHTSNVNQLLSILTDKSIAAISLTDSQICFRHVLQLLKNPSIR